MRWLLASACLVVLGATPLAGAEPTRSTSDPEQRTIRVLEDVADANVAESSFLPDLPPTTQIARLKDRFSSGSDRVAVDVFRPDAQGNLPVVLLLHGAHPKKAERHYLRMAEELAANGYLSVYVRYFERGRKGRGTRGQWRTTVHDAVTFASGLAGADPGRIGIVGYSLGAFLALGRAPLDDRIGAVVAYYGGISVDTPAEVPRTMPPALLLHGTADFIVPVRRSIQAHQAIREHGRTADIVIYPGARHGFCLNGRGGTDGLAAVDAWSRTLAFLDFHLQSPPPPGPPLTPATFDSAPLCSPVQADMAPFLSNPPRYLAPMGLGSSALVTLVNPPEDQVASILAAAAKAQANRRRARSKAATRPAPPPPSPQPPRSSAVQ